MSTATRGGLRFRHLVALAVALSLVVAVGYYVYDEEHPYSLQVSWAGTTAVAAVAWSDGGAIHNEEGHSGYWAVAVAPAHRYALLTVSAALAPRGPVTCTITYKGATVDGPRTGAGVHCQTTAVY